MEEREHRRRAVVTLLHSVRNRRALARNALVDEAVRATPARRAEFAAQLPAIVEEVVDALAAESEQQRRRFTVLRRSDIAREAQATVARDLGLSRSQFYRDLHDAREALVDALEERFGLGANGSSPRRRDEDARFVAIETLRTGGRYEQACAMASRLAREAAAPEALRALCTRADLENELGSFADARRTLRQARALLPHVADPDLRALLGMHCDAVDFEATHCQGHPESDASRRALIDTLRTYGGPYRRDYAALLVKALVEEASICFERGEATRALETIGEAGALVAREPLTDSRLAVNVKIRSSGIRALWPDQVGLALEESREIVETGRRSADAHSLRVGMQMTSAHLLTLGRLDDAKRYALEARALIDLFGSTLDRVIVLSNLARIDILRRDGAEALRWIRMARKLPCAAFTIANALAISEAEALVLVDQTDRAVGMARALSARMDDWPRLLGRAKLAEAISLAAAGSEREARVCSDQAVELSRLDGSPLAQVRALELNARLTGSRASRAALQDLRLALNA